MKNLLNGIPVKDPELMKDFTYFMFAFYFHYTPDEIDRIESYRVDAFSIMLPEWLKKLREMNRCPLASQK